MLARLYQLNAHASKTHRDPKNPIRDVLIAHTAINVNATLISDDPQLRQLVAECGGRAISVRDAGVSHECPAKNKSGRRVANPMSYRGAGSGAGRREDER
jgi:hypothetical protein